MGISYKDAGVDIDAGARAVNLMKGAVNATHGPEVLAGVGSFGGLFDGGAAFSGLARPVLVASTDGVGTKTKIAVALGRFDTIGHDIVNHCANDILVQGARPLFFLDYIASSSLSPEMVATAVTGAAEACKAIGCALLGGETAEMPGVYESGEFDLVGTIVGVVDREAIIDGSTIEPGDAVVAIPSSGLHTNGFSLARHVLADYAFTDELPELGNARLGDVLLAPHRAYVREFAALQAAGVTVKGMAHITGGGLYDNPPRILPDHVAMELDRGAWQMPAIFELIQRTGNIAPDEMARVFNCGLGMLVVVPSVQTQAALDALADGLHVGKITARADAPVVLHG
jgi:phosphoribosylformylglycinamidine cyclo-ligase